MAERTGDGGARTTLLLLFAVNLLNFFDRQLPGALGEPIRREFGLSDTALGLLGTAFTLIYAAVGVPIGRLSDKWVRTKLISVGVAVWSALTAASGLASSYTVLVLARLGVGVGEATCSPACQSLLGDLFPKSRRSRALGIFMLGLPLGLFLAYIAGGFLGHAFGWRACFVFACIPGLILSLLILRLKEPVRGAAELHVPTDAPASPYRAVLRSPTMWWIIASGALHNFNMYAINAFQTPFLQRFHELGLREANAISAIVLGAVGVVGLLVGGWASDRLSARRADGRLLLASSTMLAAVPCVFVALAQPAGALVSFMIPMGVGIALTFVYYATVYAAIQDVIEPRLRGTAVALYFFAMYVLGASLGPLVTGMLSDALARRAMEAAGSTVMSESFRASGLHDAMYVIPALALVCAGVLFAGSRTMLAGGRVGSLAVARAADQNSKLTSAGTSKS
jgi:predicted MFS family arabinose efflux permease